VKKTEGKDVEKESAEAATVLAFALTKTGENYEISILINQEHFDNILEILGRGMAEMEKATLQTIPKRSEIKGATFIPLEVLHHATKIFEAGKKAGTTVRNQP